MTSFNDILLARTRPDGGDIFGAVAAVADQNGRLVLASSGGRRNYNSVAKPDLDTTLWAYSFTKLLTTIAALQCVERGQIGLDDPVGDILPELKAPQIIGPGDDKLGSKFAVTPANGNITLRQLLTHTSGVGYDAMNPLLTAWRESRGEPIMTMCGDVVKAYSTPLLFEPGQSWAYGGGVDWAGQVVERLNGERLGDYMEREIFSRLGMKNTTFNINKNPSAKLNLMDMSTRTPQGQLTRIDNPYPEDAQSDSGGMGAVTSVGDFVRVLTDLIKDEPQLLHSETRGQMFKPQFDAVGKQAEGMLAMGFMHENLTGGEKSLGSLSYGLGGLVTVKDTPNLPAGTLSWGGMPNIVWFVHKEKGVAACYGCQIMPPGDEASTAMIAEFAKEAWKHSSNS